MLPDTINAVTVLMSVYNGESYVRQAAESILSQNYANFYLVVVNDGSTDDTARIIREFKNDPRVSVLCNSTNLGLANSLNFALSKIDTPFVLRMDADDILLPGAIREQMKEITRSKSDICFCRFYKFNPMAGTERLWRDMDVAVRPWRVLFSNYYGPHCGVIYRRSSILSVGGYDPVYERAEDYDLWDRCIQEDLKLCNHQKPLISVREHEEAVTQKHNDEMIDRERSISHRAIRRFLPSLSEEGLDGLRWLMLKRSNQVSDVVIKAGLDNCFQLVDAFLEKTGMPFPNKIWDDVATALAVRYRGLSGSLRVEARRRLIKAMWRAGSIYSMARCLRALLAS